MFERYTEKARRAVFFARYEAAQFGSPFIETEHLLLGVLRESRDPLRWFGEKLLSYEELRSQVEKLRPAPKPVSASVDVPLANESKRVLVYAAEEAERLSHRHIGTEHLILGLLREKDSAAAGLLTERGIILEAARSKIAHSSLSASPTFGARAAGSGRELPSRVREYQRFAWQVCKWKPRDILVDRQNGRVMFYTGQEFDDSMFQLTPGGWKRDHCVLCNREITETDDPQHGLAYSNGRDWICTGCYDEFFQPPLTPLHDLYT